MYLDPLACFPILKSNPLHNVSDLLVVVGRVAKNCTKDFDPRLPHQLHTRNPATKLFLDKLNKLFDRQDAKGKAFFALWDAKWGALY